MYLLKSQIVKTNKFLHIVFGLGIIVGFIIVKLYKGIFLNDLRMFDYTELSMIDMAVFEKSALFVFILRRRLWALIIVYILSTTYLGAVIVLIDWVSYGIGTGIAIATLIFKYGMYGGGLFLGMIFPQAFIYAPMVWLLLHWSLSMYFDIYINKQPEKLYIYLFRLLILIAMLATGAFLESLLNPFILKLIIK